MRTQADSSDTPKRVPPTSTSPNAREAAEDIAQQPAVDLALTGVSQPAVEPVPILTAAEMYGVKFMEEPVQVFVHEGREENAVDVISINVSGEDCFIRRGVSQVIKRKFVQQLLDMRETNFSQPKRDQFNVQSGNALLPRTSLIYPFAVERDDNRNGVAWLQMEQRRIAGSSAHLRTM